MAQDQAGETLTALPRYLWCAYVPTVMKIKHRYDAVLAARHLHAELHRQGRCCRDADLPLLRAKVSCNAFMVQEENIVLA